MFPALIALTLYFALAALLPRRLGSWRYALAAPALLVAVFDYLENAAVSVLLDMGPAVTPKSVATASQWTVLKSTTTAIVSTVLLILLAWHGIRTLRQRLKSST